VFDARGAKSIQTDKYGNLAARHIVTHIYLSGEKMDLKTLLPPRLQKPR